MAGGGLTGKWTRVEAALTTLARPSYWQGVFDRAAEKEANRLRSILVQGFNRGGPPGNKWAPLSAFTQLVSRAEGLGDRRPLKKQGDLRNSIAVVHEGDVWFVGVHRSAKNRNGDDLVNIALVHERGTRRFTVEVTDKMRKYFWWLHFQTGGQTSPLSPSTTHLSIRIPARALFGPVWDREEANSIANIRNDIVKALSVAW